MAIHYASWQRKNLPYFYVRRKAPVPVQRSPWKKIVQLGRDQEFILYLGINLSAFEILLSAFNRVWPRNRTIVFSSQDVLGLDKLDLQIKASLFYVLYDARLCLVLLGPGYSLPASMSSPTFLARNWIAITWEDQRILLYDPMQERIAQDLYMKLLDMSQGHLLCDAAFPKYGQVGSRVLSPMK